MNHSLTNSDDAIDKVLAGLRSAEPPTGMNQRITAALQNHAAVSTRTTLWRPRLAWLVVPVAAAGLVATLIIPSTRHHAHDPAQQNALNTHATPQPSASSLTTPSTAYTTPARTAARLAPKADLKMTSAAQDHGHDMDALAEDEMRAASQPAPPMPLTEQEKLLLRITRNRHPVQLAALNPAIKAQHDAQEEADFQRFFAPPELPQNGDSE